MFCKECGQENHPDNNYCINDGAPLQELEKSTILRSTDMKFCTDCGEKIEKEDSYCINCGKSVFTPVKEEDFNLPDIKLPEMKIPNIKMGGFNLKGTLDIKNKSSFIFGGIGFLIAVVLAFILSSTFNKVFSAILAEELGSYSGALLGDSFNVKIIGPIMAIPLLSAAKIKALAVGKSVGVHIGYILPILVSILVFTILGYIKAAKDEEKNLTELVINSLVYSILMAIVSIFSREKVGGIDFLGLSLVIKYSFFSVLINSFLLSLIGFTLGYSINKKKEGYKLSNPIGNNILDGVLSFGFLFSIIFLLSFIFIDKGDMPEDGAFIIIQFAAYVFGMVNLAPFYFDQEKISVLSSIGDMEDFSSLSLASIVLFILLIIIYMAYKGKRERRAGNKLFFIRPLIYSLISAIILSLVSIKIDGDISDFVDFNILGFRIIPSFISIAILSLVTSLAGYLLGAREVETLNE